MSPTATTSEAAAGRRRTRFAPRWLVVAHRYLGVALGGLMLLWCLSGFVMLGVHWPEVTPAERAAGLQPIGALRGHRLQDAAPDNQPVGSAVIEAMAGRPVLRLRTPDGDGQTLDLATGEDLAPLGRTAAVAVAKGYSGGAQLKRADLIAHDQWTVAISAAKCPVWRVRLEDAAATDLYVSAPTGELVQRTTRAARVLNWFGPIPHWLYPALLRQDAKLWSQVVIWTSLAGTFLTLGGLYLGVVAWRSLPDPRRQTPFRGLVAWHHLASLAAGVLTLTWVASGLISMNPWGFLESPSDPAAARLSGPAPSWFKARQALEAAAAGAPSARQLTLAPLAGAMFVMADGVRLDAMGRPSPLGFAELTGAAEKLGPVTAEGLIQAGDAYYFPHHEAVRLPAWRVVLADGRRYYLDPGSGQLLAGIDAQARGYRWLHQAPHRLDFIPGFDRGPVWAEVTALLLAAVTLGVGAGVWLACRRIAHDFRGMRGG